jgi:uncharacterized protein
MASSSKHFSRLKRRINFAFPYGSIARSRENAESDIDLMIVGWAHFGDVVAHLAEAQKTVNRQISPTVYSTREFSSKVLGNFLKTILPGKKMFLIGDESDLRASGKQGGA